MENRFEYKSVRIASSGGCLILDRLLDLSLNKESQEGWQLFTIFSHCCSESSCLVAIFQRETRT